MYISFCTDLLTAVLFMSDALSWGWTSSCLSVLLGLKYSRCGVWILLSFWAEWRFVLLFSRCCRGALAGDSWSSDKGSLIATGFEGFLNMFVSPSSPVESRRQRFERGDKRRSIRANKPEQAPPPPHQTFGIILKQFHSQHDDSTKVKHSGLWGQKRLKKTFRWELKRLQIMKNRPGPSKLKSTQIFDPFCKQLLLVRSLDGLGEVADCHHLNHHLSRSERSHFLRLLHDNLNTQQLSKLWL